MNILLASPPMLAQHLPVIYRGSTLTGQGDPHRMAHLIQSLDEIQRGRVGFIWDTVEDKPPPPPHKLSCYWDKALLSMPPSVVRVHIATLGYGRTYCPTPRYMWHTLVFTLPLTRSSLPSQPRDSLAGARTLQPPSPDGKTEARDSRIIPPLILSRDWVPTRPPHTSEYTMGLRANACYTNPSAPPHRWQK